MGIFLGFVAPGLGVIATALFAYACYLWQREGHETREQGRVRLRALLDQEAKEEVARLLRQELASMAMQGILASGRSSDNEFVVAKEAIKVADALIIEGVF